MTKDEQIDLLSVALKPFAECEFELLPKTTNLAKQYLWVSSKGSSSISCRDIERAREALEATESWIQVSHLPEDGQLCWLRKNKYVYSVPFEYVANTCYWKEGKNRIPIEFVTHWQPIFQPLAPEG